MTYSGVLIPPILEIVPIPPSKPLNALAPCQLETKKTRECESNVQACYQAYLSTK